MKTRKILLIGLILFSLLFVVACGDQRGVPTSDPQDLPQVEDQGQNEDEMAMDDDMEDNPQKDLNSQEDEQTIAGIFVGWIDGNSFEVKMGDDIYTIRVSEDVDVPMNIEGSNVEVSFTENEQGQNIATYFVITK